MVRRAKMAEIKRNFERVQELQTEIAERCEENARDQQTGADQLKAAREKTDRHIERLENGFEDENTDRITLYDRIPPTPTKR